MSKYVLPSRIERGTEIEIVAVTSAAALLATHSNVALLSVGSLARRTGERFGVSDYRPANLVDGGPVQHRAFGAFLRVADFLGWTL